MSRSDAERAMEIYRNFTKQTNFVVAYLSTARQYEHQTRVEVPKLKHAPVNLEKQLDDYMMDPDFEINRRQYLAEQDSKKSKGGANGTGKPLPTMQSGSKDATTSKTGQQSASKAAAAKGPDPDLIDFFDSIEQNQQPMAFQPNMQQAGMPQYGGGPMFQMQPPGQAPQLQEDGFVTQQTGFQNPNQLQQQPFNTGVPGPQQFQPAQANPTGAGFGAYTTQPAFRPGGMPSIPQDPAVSFPAQVPQQSGNSEPGSAPSTNPFRQTMSFPVLAGIPGQIFSGPPPTTAPQPPTRQSTNPFAKSVSPQATQPFPPPPNQQSFQQPQAAAPLQAMATGTNPFARGGFAAQRPQTSGGLMPQPTGSTNPFRQSQFVNTATGAGWQNNQQAMGGGLDSLDAVPVFPRPAQQQPWQQ